MNLILSKLLRILVVLCLFVNFTIFNQNGYLSVRGEDGKVLQTGVLVSTLPESDAERIDRTIVCPDELRLHEVLENYIS